MKFNHMKTSTDVWWVLELVAAVDCAALRKPHRIERVEQELAVGWAPASRTRELIDARISDVVARGVAGRQTSHVDEVAWTVWICIEITSQHDTIIH